MMYKSGIVCFIFFFSFITRLNGQTHNPRLWYLGYQSPARDTNTLDTGVFLQSGSSILDFRNSPISQYRVANTLSIGDCNAFIFDDKDSLVLYSNGSKVFNRKHRLIEGADSLNYGASTWASSPFTGSYFAEFYITLFNQAITILPIPNQKNKYALISIFINGDTDRFYKITYSVLDMNLNGGLGKMVLKEKTIALGDFTESINAVRHGNGRDWWLISREYTTNTCYTIMLLDSNGIKVVSRNQCNSFDLKDRTAVNRIGLNKFSWDGKLFVSFSHKGIELFDFNRCTGILSNRREVKTEDTVTYLVGGVFSPDNKLLYANNYKNLYQIEIASLNVIKVSQWDGLKDSTGSFPYTLGFRIPNLASDGKIYYGTTAFTHYLHRIDYPNVKGAGCNVVQRAVKIQTLNSGIPHFPNFELGTDTCWRSSIENGRDLNIEVYPNPASDYVEVSSYQWSVGSKIALFNILGQQTDIKVELIDNHFKIDTRALSEGIYLLQIRDKNDTQIKTERIVIQRDQ